mgnify:CR=1 FL=1
MWNLFHQNTIKIFLDLLGSLGLDSAEALEPYHIIQRIKYGVVKSLSEAYLYLEAGQLLGNNPPEAYKAYWDMASADAF